MAVTARRTLAKVKSSAIRPRHPEVPNLMGEVVMRRYSRPGRVESRKLPLEVENSGTKTAASGTSRSGVSEYCFEPGRVVLHLEGQAGESARVSAGDEDDREASR